MKRIVGIKQVLKAVESGVATRVFVAEDADFSAVEKVISLAKEKEIETVFVSTRAQLGKKCCIAVGAAAAAEVKE
ncbi:MAG: ribosomal L7Ae/L30e/S12e/Gadd45 family protein [Clostridia bacterium]|nr:ribosomal L7Ae/L30e/S12e/Gadd45 family protein [Clostridia bacterium]